MKPDQVKAIQDSFSKLKPISEQVVRLFYGRLFEIAPRIKPVKAIDYPPVGAALLWALEHSLGQQWIPELAVAWKPHTTCCRNS